MLDEKMPGLWAARLCLAMVGLLALVGAYYGNVRFTPIAAGFAILAGVCYAECRTRRARAHAHVRARVSSGARGVPRVSLTSGNAPRISSDSAHPLGP